VFDRYEKKEKEASPSELKAAIVEYLEKYPEAKDTIVGIAGWWVSEDPHQVEKVLEELVEKGLIEKKNFSSLVLYSLGLAFKRKMESKSVEPIQNGQPNKEASWQKRRS